MQLTEDREQGIVILQVAGRLDSNTSNPFQEKLTQLIGQGEKCFVIDFSNLDYISSAGLRVLLWTVKQLNNADGKLVLSALKDYIREVFDIAGFIPIFPLFGSKEDALKAFQ
jgi:anti-sigma B factor antagonist